MSAVLVQVAGHLAIISKKNCAGKRPRMKSKRWPDSNPITLALVVALAISASESIAQQSPPPTEGSAASASEVGLSEQEKAQIREMGIARPAETEKTIQKLDAERKEASRRRQNPGAVRDLILPLLQRLEKANRPDSLQEFQAVRLELSDKLRALKSQRVSIPRDLGNQLAERVLLIYEARAKFSDLPDYFPIEVAAEYGSSPTVKRFLTGILRGQKGPAREYAINRLAWSQSLRGDPEIFDILNGLYRDEWKSNPAILGTMSRLDREKALPLVVQEIQTTDDVGLFNKGADLISEYGRTELLDHVLKRVKDFPKAALAAENNPTTGIYPELLVRYIDQASGERLEWGLGALEQNAQAILKGYSVLARKLQSPDARSRKAVAACLANLAIDGKVSAPRVSADLQGQQNREPDAGLKEEIRQSLENIKRRTARPGP